MSIEIRKATAMDMESVHKLIVELAAFEKMKDQAEISVNTLIQDGFGPNPTFGCFVAERTENDTKTLIGYSVYFTCYSTWLGRTTFLEGLYVQENYRQTGIGSKLFKAVAKIALETSGRFDFYVLSWNPAKTFYKKCGAINLSELEAWQLFRMPKESLDKLLA